MPTNAKVFDFTKIHQGPGDLWIIGGGVTDSALPILTLTAGIPDNIAHPNSQHLGPTEAAITFAVKPKMEPIRADQAEGPIGYYLTDLESSLEADMLMMDPKLVQQSQPFTVFTSSVAAAGITFGGSASVFSNVCVACIAPKRTDASKYTVSVIFSAMGTMGWGISITRKKTQSYKAQFSCQQDLSRALGRQIGIYYETLT